MNDITKDLTNCVELIELAEILTHKEPPSNWTHDSKHIEQMLTNNYMTIDMFMKDCVHFVGISGKGIYVSKQKLVFCLVWTLIWWYSINESITNDKKVN